MIKPAARAEIQRQFETGLSMHRQGKLGLAESHYARVVKLDPAQAEAWHLLGVVSYQSGNLVKAIKHYRKAVELRPGLAQAWNNLGIALKSRGEHVAAAEAFERAFQAQPDYYEAAFNVALLHEEAGRLEEAESAYRRALAARPDEVNALGNFGNLLVRTQRAGEGARLLAKAHALAPSAATAGNLALAHLQLGHYRQAATLAEVAILAEPDVATWWGALGSALRLQGDVDGALPALRRVCDSEQHNAMAWFEYGLALAATGDDAGAHAALSHARLLQPDLSAIAWADALLLPALVEDDFAVDAAITRFASGIESLSAQVVASTIFDASEQLDAAAGANSYHLHYLPRDTTALQLRFGDLLHTTVTRALPELAMPAAWRPLAHGGPMRVGFVSAFFSRHTVSRYFNALIAGLDPARFERFVWHTGESVDATAKSLADAVEHFNHVNENPPDLAQRIRDARLDVLVFPDVGMDPRQNIYAALRLAPVQIALYGHPVSSGLPNVDAYVSGELLEPANAQSHYRERLLQLPGIGAAVACPTESPQTAWFEAIRGSRPTLLCTQNLSKLTSAFDAALVRILARSGARVVLFDRGPALTRRYLARLGTECSRAGLAVDDVVLAVPVRPYAEFLGAIAAADLVLDTPWFSGGGTSLDAFAVGAPVLAWESGFARGRQTAGMLRAMDLPQLITRDADAYVEAAVRLLGDPAERAALSQAIKARSGVLFDASAVVAAFSALLESEAAR